jgi:L-ascorbate metabolism protein UlaG (beta-lactamase superfamily)
LEPKVEWLGHASFRIHTSRGIVYIDPWKTAGAPKADLIVITHTHPDHLSMDDITKLKKDNTIIIGSKDVTKEIPEAVTVLPGSSKNVSGIKVEAIRAYNLEKEFHPKENDWLGVDIDVRGFRVYHTGDPDVIQEMSGLKDIDVALVPVGGTYTMTCDEAVKAMKLFNPKKAVPMHWGDIIGSDVDAKKFKEMADCDVEIMDIVK